MVRPRFSIAAILLIVPVIAIGCAALAQPSDLWASVLFTLTLGLLATATLCAILARPDRRAAWVGFAVFGWCYLFFTFLYVDYRVSLRPVKFPQLLPDLIVGFFVPEATPQGYYLKGIVHSMATALSGLIGSCLGAVVAARQGEGPVNGREGTEARDAA